MKKALHLVLVGVNAVILSLFWVYSDNPTRSYKSLDLGYAQKPFLGYFPKYFMEMPKIFFVCFSPIEKHETLKKLKYFAKKNIFYEKLFFRAAPSGTCVNRTTGPKKLIPTYLERRQSN